MSDPVCRRWSSAGSETEKGSADIGMVQVAGARQVELDDDGIDWSVSVACFSLNSSAADNCVQHDLMVGMIYVVPVQAVDNGE